jgi:hypothetical protein
MSKTFELSALYALALGTFELLCNAATAGAFVVFHRDDRRRRRTP